MRQFITGLRAVAAYEIDRAKTAGEAHGLFLADRQKNTPRSDEQGVDGVSF